jgi:hypothetical protein
MRLEIELIKKEKEKELWFARVVAVGTRSEQ